MSRTHNNGPGHIYTYISTVQGQSLTFQPGGSSFKTHLFFQNMSLKMKTIRK